VSPFEFLSRISFFSVLCWCFFLVAVVCALILTNVRSPLVRRYRSTLISVAISGIILGVASWATPFFLRRLNPDQSRLTPIEQLTLTRWEEPLSNPETVLPEDETSWLKNLPAYHFKFKLHFNYDFKQVITLHESTLIVLDQKGDLRGFNAYTGLNHWWIKLGTDEIVGQLQLQRKMFLLDHTDDALRVSCLDLQNASLLWQRTIPNSKEGALTFDLDSQVILVTTGTNGVWALRARTGGILWKRPEIYTKTLAIPSPQHVLVVEPFVAKRHGSWYELDPQTGKTLLKKAHPYSSIEEFLPVDPERAPPENFLALTTSPAQGSAPGTPLIHQLFYLSHLDLHQWWSYSLPEALRFARFIDPNRYFLMYDSKMLEQRHLQNNDLIWQKKLADISTDWLKISPDRKYFVLLSDAHDETAGVSFFNLDTGDYLFTAKTSEPIDAIEFFGDWFYLFSEGHLWAFQRGAFQKGSPSPCEPTANCSLRRSSGGSASSRASGHSKASGRSG